MSDTDRLAEIEARRDEGVEILLEVTNALIARVRELEAQAARDAMIVAKAVTFITSDQGKSFEWHVIQNCDDSWTEATEMYYELEAAVVAAREEGE